MIGVFTFLMRWIGPANYGVFAVMISALVVLLLTINGVSPKEVILARGLNTAVGGVLALLAYLAWPTWERSRVGDNVAAVLRAYGKYFSAVAKSYMEKGSVERFEIERARQDGRTARTNLEAVGRTAGGGAGSHAGSDPANQRDTREFASIRSCGDGARSGIAADAGCPGTF